MNRTKKNIEKFKAIELISTFSVLEMKRFGRFLLSPYHNNNPSIIALFGYLKPLYPTFNQKKLNRASIWKALYHTALPFDAIKFKKLFSELNLLAEEFIIIEQRRSDKRTQQKQLITALASRQFKRFVRESQMLIKTLEKKGPYISQADYLDLHVLYQGLWYHNNWEKHQVNQKELLAAHEALVDYMAFNKVRTVAELATRSKFLNLAATSPSKTLVVADDAAFTKRNQLYALFYNLLAFEEKPNWTAYQNIKNQLQAQYGFLTKGSVRDATAHLNNYLAKEIASGKDDLRLELFHLLKWVAEQQVFIENDSIEAAIYSNTITNAISLRQLDWAKNYRDLNKPYLKSAYKELILGYLDASLAFAEQKYPTVISILMPLQPSHKLQYYFYFKSLIIRSYFELLLLGQMNFWEALNYELAAFEKGVSRNKKFSKARKVNLLNYIKTLKKLSDLLLNKELNKNSLEDLRTKTVAISPLAYKKWLLEKIDFLNERC